MDIFRKYALRIEILASILVGSLLTMLALRTQTAMSSLFTTPKS